MLTITDVANAKHVKYGLKKQTFDYGNVLEDHPCGEIPGSKCCAGGRSGAGSGKYGYEIKETAIPERPGRAVWNGRLQILEEHPLLMDGAITRMQPQNLRIP